MNQSGSQPNRLSMMVGSIAIDTPKPTKAATIITGTSHTQSRNGIGRRYGMTDRIP
jgi:hypothetical protein